MLRIDQLLQILSECSGDEQALAQGEDILDREFEDLGYDSLVLLETTAQLKHLYDIDIPEDVIRDLKTPRAVLEYVNVPASRN
ncbi:MULTISPECIES: acyl carrier protein [Streptomyces]|uniref:Act minimal PKS acyl carrier protein n=2 Tax=Streptomyces TaxID=1883 RepID=A0ABT9KHS1_9ACTN|nr:MULTISPECIES: acyl carrier protein [Streptomyces]AKE48656.1 putative acyl carrier protein [Streptomyces sp. SH-62]MDP9607954.1 act minimal PKS acyl carrier protein [Streptomyces demainii]NUH41261.1 acyl carrier protein [Streptomyces samsunensis]